MVICAVPIFYYFSCQHQYKYLTTCENIKKLNKSTGNDTLYIGKMTKINFSDEYFMQQALKEAQIAAQKDEIPVGAVVVCNNQIISRAHNLTETLNDVTAHAEMLAITAAAEYLGGKYLNECTLYVTLEPCAMCAGALKWSQIGKIVFGAKDPKRGFSLHTPPIKHTKTEIKDNILSQECSEIVKYFFKNKR